MGLTTAMWTELQKRLAPEAWRDLIEYCAETDDVTHEDVIAKAIKAHESYTGITLTFHF